MEFVDFKMTEQPPINRLPTEADDFHTAAMTYYRLAVERVKDVSRF